MPDPVAPSGSSRAAAGPAIARSLLAAFPPGVLLGIHVAALLYFLNPELTLSPLSAIRAVTLYAAVLGTASIVLILPFTYRHPRRAWRALPWSLTAALTASAYAYWLQASYFSYYLEPGLNLRLIKAAIGLTVFALVGFYTALLHSIHRRPYGIRSRTLFVLLPLVSLLIVFERRTAFQPPTEPLPRPAVVEADPTSRLLVVALDGATLDAILPLASQGRLPTLAQLMNEGAYGRLVSFPPARRAPLWTSLASGRYPWEHRILAEAIYPADFLSSGAVLGLTPAGIGFQKWGVFGSQPQRLDARYRQAPTIWEIFERLGVPAGILGWPGSHPAFDGEGYAFSNRFFAGEFSGSAVQPPGIGERGALFRVAPDEIEPGQIGSFGPAAPPAVLDALAQDIWRESLASVLLEQNREVRAVFLMLPGLALVSEAYFGAFAAARFEGAQSEEISRAARVLDAYYMHLDAYVGRLRQRLTPADTLVVVSAYGFDAYPPVWKGVRILLGRDRRHGTKAFAPDGVFFIKSRGVRAGTFLNDIEITDVLPTLLYASGLPIARDARGRVLTEAFENSLLATRPLVFVPSYETLRPLSPPPLAESPATTPPEAGGGTDQP